MNEGEQEHLEKLKQELYGRKSAPPPLRRSHLGELVSYGREEWQRVEPLRRADSFLTMSRLKKLFWWSLGFFCLALVLALFVAYRGNNLVSSSNLEIKISGPTEVSAGQEVSLQVLIQNKNRVALELADLIVEYPAGTRVAGAVDQALTRERLPLGTIAPGASANQTVRAVLFGEKGNNEIVNFRVEYRLADSRAIFDRKAEYAVGIGSTPLVVLLDLPAEVNSDQEIVLNVQVQSNSESLITKPMIVLEYPAGFRFSKSTPPPIRGQDIWQLDDLKPGQKAIIQVRGTLEGQDEEQKSFRASAGTMDKPDADELSATYGSAFSTLVIKRPFVGLRAMVNESDDSEYVASGGEPVRVNINWVNNLPTEVVDAQVLVSLAGRVIDPLSVTANRGFYDSRANTVLWSKLNKSDLASLPPGGSGQVVLTFSPQSLLSTDGASLRQPTATLDIKFKAKRISDGGKSEEIFSTLSKKVKFSSLIQLAGKVLYRTGPFANSGPVPPKVGQSTTYTVTWSILNSSNNLEASKVTATLPPYVRWVGASQPAAETLKFQPSESGGGQVVWELGSVSAGVGTQTPAREVSFQLALTPSLSQVGESPTLVEDPTFSALDTFTKQILTAKLKRTLDTQFVSEPGFKLGDDRVTN